MGFSIKKKLKDIYEVFTPQNEGALRAANSTLQAANQSIASNPNPQGVLGNFQARQQFIAGQQPTQFNARKEAVNILGNSLLGNTARLANTVTAAAQDVAPTAKIVAAQVTRNPKALANANQEALRVRQQTLKGDGRILGAGTFLGSSAEDVDRNTFSSAIKKAGLNSAGVAGEVVPIVKPLVLANAGNRARIAANAAYGAATNVAADTAQQLGNTGKINLKDTVIAGVTGAVPGGLTVAGKQAAAIAPTVARNTAQRVDQAAFTPRNQPRINLDDRTAMENYIDLSRNPDSNLKPSDTVRIEQDARAAAQRNGIKLNQPSRGQNADLLDEFFQTRNRVSQGGYVGKDPNVDATGRPLSESQNPANITKPQSQTRRIVQRDQPQTVRLASQETPSNSPINTSDYIRERLQAQEAARKAESPQGFRARTEDVRSKFKKNFIDSLSPIEDVINRNTNGQRDLAPEQRISPQLDRALRADMIGEQYRVDNGLNDIIKNTRDPNALGQYLIAKRSLDIGKNVETGRNLDTDRQLVSDLADEFEPQAQKIKQYQQNLLDTAVNYGLMSKERAAQLKQENPNYIPFERIFNEEELAAQQVKGAGKGNASISSQTIDRKIKGSNREIEDPLESLVRRTQDVIAQGERNKAANMLITYKDLPGNPFDLRQLEPSETVGSKPVISAFQDGKQVRYETTPEVAAAAKSLDTRQLGIIEKFFNIGTRVLRLGATSANAAFSLANLAADTGGAFINSRDPLTSILNPDVLKFALSSTFREKGAAYGELRRAAAGGTSFDIGRQGQPKSVARIRSERNLATKGAYTVKNPGELLRVVEDFIGRTETFTRAAQYKGGKIGAMRRNPEFTELQASIEGAVAARANSANFYRGGNVAKVLNSVLPYLNAGFQSARSFNNALRARPAQTLTKVGLIGLLPTATTVAWNLSDPDRRKIYESMQEYEKDNNFIVILPGAKVENGRATGIIKVPSPFVIRGFQKAIRQQIEKNPDESEPLLKSLIEGTVQSTTSLTPDSKIFAQVVPQGIKPAAETILNRNFYTGEQIVPDAIKNLDAKDQYNKGTSGTAKVIGKLTDTSPLKIDNAFRTATGGLGQNIINTSDTALAKAGVIKPEDVKGKSVGGSIAARFNSAAVITDGSKYFEELEKQAKNNKLAGSDLDQLNSITSKALDTNGQPRLLNDNDDLERNQILRSSPNIAKVLADTNKEIAKKTGNPIDPLYNLSPEEQGQIYDLKSLPYKGEDYQLALDKMPWYDDFQEKRGKYFEEINKKRIAGGSAEVKSEKTKFPTFSEQQQNLLDKANELEGADKADFIKKNPEIQKAYDALSKYTNDKRIATGRVAFKGYPKADAATNAIIDEYNSLPKADGKNGGNATRNAWIKTNPDKYAKMQDFFAKTSEWTLANNAGLDKFEGQELNQKALKATYSLGQYSISKQENADGTSTYSLDPQKASADKQSKQNSFYASKGRGGGRRGGRSKTIRIKSSRMPRGSSVRIKKGPSIKTVKVSRPRSTIKTIRKTQT